MVRAATFAAAALPLAAAFPSAMFSGIGEQIAGREAGPHFVNRDVTPPTRQPSAKSGRGNLGVQKATGFNAKNQYVDITEGSGHEFQSPKSSDRRGQCPGLNAAANHGFLPRSGIATIADTVNGLGAAYNMGPDLAAVLAVLSIALSGDPIAGTWSIGGGYPGTLDILGDSPGGIYSLHSKYEGDASIIRGDAYLNNGLVDVFQMRSWEHLMNLGPKYTPDIMNGQNDYVQQYSIANNPYYFTGFFSGLVTPAAHDFVINFMSNHSEEVPDGELTREHLKTFFSVTGDKAGEYKHIRNQERIPDNFYKRPVGNAYALADVFENLLVDNTVYPGIIRIGGNTGKVNTFTGVNFEDLTGGVFNGATLLEGNNLACFFLQATRANTPDLISNIQVLLGNTLNPLIKNLGCQQLDKLYNNASATFPGASYQATGNGK